MHSQAGRGTRFSLELPLGDPGAQHEPRFEVTRPPGQVDLSGLYVFYVEDDALVRASCNPFYSYVTARLDELIEN